jgi:hypothetical protein
MMKRLILVVLVLLFCVPLYATTYAVKNYCEDETAWKYGTQTVIDDTWKAAGCESHTVRDFTVLSGEPNKWHDVDVAHFSSAGSRDIALPGESMGANGAIRINVIFRNASGSSQTAEVTFGSTVIFSLPLADGNSVNPRIIQVWNVGATNSQRAMGTDAAGHGAYSSAILTPSEDTTSIVTINFDSSSTGNLIIEYASVEVIYME